MYVCICLIYVHMLSAPNIPKDGVVDKQSNHTTSGTMYSFVISRVDDVEDDDIT